MKIKTLFAAGALALAGAVGLIAAEPTYAVTCPQGSVNATATTLAECNLTHHENDLMPTINVIINVIIGVIGIVAVIVIVLGALQYTTSSGDAAKLKKAKDTILYGVVGLIISLLAFAIVNFVLTSVFSGSSSGGGDDDEEEEGGYRLEIDVNDQIA